MKLYKREDFLKLPKMTIYSRIDNNIAEVCYGLFCKTSDLEYMTGDWVEQDLIGEGLASKELTSGTDILDFVLEKRDSFKDFRLDYDLAGRDGMYEDKDTFVVWDNEDISQLVNYLLNCIKT